MPLKTSPAVVGVIAAAGRATRLAPMPCSKELLPIGIHRSPAELRGRPKPVSFYLFEKMRRAGADRLFVVLRDGKFDIARYYGDGSRLGLSMAYLMMNEPWGPPFTAAQAAPFVGDAVVLFGFPDILVAPEDGFERVRERLLSSGADLVLGLFRGKLQDGLDLVRTDDGGRVCDLITKEEDPPRQEGDTGYMLAAWGPGFTRFLVAETARLGEQARAATPGTDLDWPMGAVFAAAVRAGLHVDSVFFPDAQFLDVGTPAGLAAASAFPGVWSGHEDEQ